MAPDVRTLAKFALPFVIVLMVLCPAIGVVLTGRNLQTAEALVPLEASPLAGRILWTASLASVIALLLVVSTRGTFNLSRRRDPTALGLIAAFLVYFTTNVIVPGTMGEVNGIERSYYYVLLLFIAIYAAHDDNVDPLLRAAKGSLLAFMLASLAISIALPEATLRTYGEELRLPLIPFRFWGLSSGPNTVGPMGLALILIAVVHPFRSRLWQRLAYISGAIVILLAQSQTTWTAALVILPALLLYRRHLARYGKLEIGLSPSLLLLLAGVAFAGLVIAIALAAATPPDRVVPTGGLREGDALLTGRGQIWAVAWDTFTTHPLFGYGLKAWESEFRAAIGMSFAAHAHNQLMQSLSVAGLTGALGLAIYVTTLTRGAAFAAASSGGLAPALLILALFRCFTEVPLQLSSLLVSDTQLHALVFLSIVGASQAPAPHGSAVRSSPSTRPRRRIKATY